MRVITASTKGFDILNWNSRVVLDQNSTYKETKYMCKWLIVSPGSRYQVDFFRIDISTFWMLKVHNWHTLRMGSTVESFEA